jgi:hypothetical protein
MSVPRLLLAGALAAAGCADTTDERPATFEYVVNAVLAPSCGTATCHNAMTRREGYAFDTIAGARASMLKDLVPIGGAVPDEVEFTKLHLVLTVDTGDEFNTRMPIDSPLPQADIDLIDRWIGEGAVGL